MDAIESVKQPITIAKEVPKVLVVDDGKANRKILCRLLEADGYDYREAADGLTALSVTASYNPDIILLDVMMPGLDGFEVAQRLKAQPETKDIPIIMVTALEDRTSRVKGLEMGAEEFISKPIDRQELQIRVRNLLRLKMANNLLKAHNRELDQRVRIQEQKIKHTFFKGLDTLMRKAEICDNSAETHTRRISRYSRILAKKIAMDEDFCDLIFKASAMHDIGKIGVPDLLLMKPASLTPQEWVVMKTHTTMGKKIFADVTSSYLKMSAEIALGHHENWDGSGYPNGIKGTNIPVSARIIRICDVYDALRSQRPYKQAMDHAAAVNIIMQGDDRTTPDQFAPEILEAFIALAESFEEVYART